MTWADRVSLWMADAQPPSIDWGTYGIGFAVAVPLCGVILRLFFQMRGDLLERVNRAEEQCAAGVAGAQRERDDAIAREREAMVHERERADRLEAALARLNAEVGPRQAAAMDGAMKAVMDAIRELKK